MRWNKRLVPALAVAVLVGGCGGSGGNTDGASAIGSSDASACPVKALASAKGPVEITVWHAAAGLVLWVLEALTDEYNSSQDKVKVKLESQGGSFGELHAKIDQAAPDRSLPAIVTPDDTKLRFAADSGLFVPAQSCFDNDPDGKALLGDVEPIIRESYSLDGMLWPAGFAAGTAVLFYNRSHFRAAGLDPDTSPATLDEMIEAARAIKAAGISQQPFVLKVTNWIFEYWLTAEGQTLVDHNNGRDGLPTKSTIDNPTARTILKKLAAAKAEGLIKVVPSAANGDEVLALATQSGSMLLSASGASSTVAAVIEGTINAQDLKAEFGVSVPEGLKLNLDLGLGALPGLKGAGKGQVGGGLFYMTNNVPEEQQSAAWDYLKFLLSKKAQTRLSIEGGAIPVLKSVANDPALTTEWTSTLAGRWNRTATDSLRLLDPKFPGPVIGPYGEVRGVLNTLIDRVMVEDGPIDDAITEADTSINKLLDDYRLDLEGS